MVSGTPIHFPNLILQILAWQNSPSLHSTLPILARSPYLAFNKHLSSLHKSLNMCIFPRTNQNFCGGLLNTCLHLIARVSLPVKHASISGIKFAIPSIFSESIIYYSFFAKDVFPSLSSSFACTIFLQSWRLYYKVRTWTL